VTLAERVAADYVRQLCSFGDRAPGRFAAEVAGVTVVSIAVDEPWGLQVVASSGRSISSVGWGVGPSRVVRGRGYGAAMMDAVRAEAAVRGDELVWLKASPGPVGFYEAIGFELVDTHLALAAS